MGWADHVARTGELRCIKILVGIPEGKRPLEDLSVDGKVMLEFILGKGVGRCGVDSSGSG
jgi:hypothetical protein